MPPLPRGILLLACAIATLFMSTRLHAQTWYVDGVRCDTCWRHFHPAEDRFRIGATGLLFPDSAQVLGVDFTRFYWLPSPGDLTRLITDTSRMEHLFWTRAATLQYHAIGAMPNAATATNSTALAENYAYASDSVHYMSLTLNAPAHWRLLKNESYGLLYGSTVRIPMMSATYSD